jgi:hypothetical protein
MAFNQHFSTTINCGQDARGPKQPQSIAELIRIDQVITARAPVAFNQHLSPTINCGQDARGPRRPAMPLMPVGGYLLIVTDQPRHQLRARCPRSKEQLRGL